MSARWTLIWPVRTFSRMSPRTVGLASRILCLGINLGRCFPSVKLMRAVWTHGLVDLGTRVCAALLVGEDEMSFHIQKIK
jgi:hypothetical protein